MRHFSLHLFILSAFITITGSTLHAVAQGHYISDQDPVTSKVKRPLTVPSNEATKKQLALARNEGDAVDKCTSWIVGNAGAASGQLRAGEYKISYAVTAPEGWYDYNDQVLTWQQPVHVNAHLWLFVQDGADGRIVPPLDITATVIDNKGRTVLIKSIPYAWMPLVNGYGNNIELPRSGDYRIKLTIGPPRYLRHDPYNGDRFSDLTRAELPVTVNLDQLKTQKPFSEAMEAQKVLSRGAGRAYAHTLQGMYKQANDGRDTLLGDYKVVYAVEYAEGFWDFEHGRFRYRVENELSGKTNAHVEVAVLDAKTGRFMHNLNVRATLIKDGKQLGTESEPFMWHPWLYHYGKNWRVPSAGTYVIHIHFDAPAYRRYGRTDGRQFAAAGNVSFGNVKIKTGQK